MTKLTWAAIGTWTAVEFKFAWIAVPENRTTMWSNTVALLKGNLQVRVQWRIREVEATICREVQRRHLFPHQ